MAEQIAVVGECCRHPDLQHMMTGAVVNAVCLSCYTHWYGQAHNVRKFSRKEWDAHLEVPEEREPSEPRRALPLLSMLQGFTAYLVDIECVSSERSMRSLTAAVSDLIDFLRDADCNCRPETEHYAAHTCSRCELLARVGGAE